MEQINCILRILSMKIWDENFAKRLTYLYIIFNSMECMKKLLVFQFFYHYSSCCRLHSQESCIILIFQILFIISQFIGDAK